MLARVARSTRGGSDTEQRLLLPVGGRSLHQHLLHHCVGLQDGLGAAGQQRRGEHPATGRDRLRVQGEEGAGEWLRGSYEC